MFESMGQFLIMFSSPFIPVGATDQSLPSETATASPSEMPDTPQVPGGPREDQRWTPGETES